MRTACTVHEIKHQPLIWSQWFAARWCKHVTDRWQLQCVDSSFTFEFYRVNRCYIIRPVKLDILQLMIRCSTPVMFEGNNQVHQTCPPITNVLKIKRKCYAAATLSTQTGVTTCTVNNASGERVDTMSTVLKTVQSAPPHSCTLNYGIQKIIYFGCSWVTMDENKYEK